MSYARSGWVFKAVVVMTAMFSLCLVGCASSRKTVQTAPPTPLEMHNAMIAEWQKAAAKDKKNAALYNLDVASMMLDVGRMDEAELTLRSAVQTMTTFKADGEFAAYVGEESTKEWKGEPYEKMAAFLELGMLLYRKGDRSNALAMFKTAILADTGTRVERFRSDLIPAWVLQSLAYQAEGETDAAAEAMNKAVDAYWSRKTAEVLLRAIPMNVQYKNLNPKVARRTPEYAMAAYSLLATSVWAGTAAAPRQPKEAVFAAVSYATSLLLEQKALSSGKRHETFKDWKSSAFEMVAVMMPELTQSWIAAVPDFSPAERALGEAYTARLEGLLTNPPNLVVLVERGVGPKKARAGRHGEFLQIVPMGKPPVPRVVLSEESRIDPIYLDSVNYQATTRGGRKVDVINHGKAVFKDTTAIVGAAALATSAAILSNAASNADLTGGAIAGVIGLASMIASASTQPQADIRQWKSIPAEWYLVAEQVPPGTYKFKVDGLRYVVTIPADGQMVDLVTFQS
jgi:tetratricopeptide (TPR) repeat protein